MALEVTVNVNTYDPSLCTSSELNTITTGNDAEFAKDIVGGFGVVVDTLVITDNVDDASNPNRCIQIGTALSHVITFKPSSSVNGPQNTTKFQNFNSSNYPYTRHRVDATEISGFFSYQKKVHAVSGLHIDNPTVSRSIATDSFGVLAPDNLGSISSTIGAEI